MPCQRLREVEDWRGDSESSPALRDHLAVCSSCAEAVVKWKHILQAVASLDQESMVLPEVDVAYTARRLVLRARHEKRDSQQARWADIGGLALAASLAALLGFVIMAQQQPASRDRNEALGFMVDQDGQVSRASYRQGEVLSVPQGGTARLEFGSDRIVLGGNSRLRLAQLEPHKVSLVLEGGEVACQVEPRGGSDDGSFEVESQGVRVRVTGTRFGVSNRGPGSVFVSVDEGEVQVFAEAQKVSVESGFGLLVGFRARRVPRPLEEKEKVRLAELLDKTPLSAPLRHEASGKPPAETSDHGTVVDRDLSSDEEEPEPTRQHRRPMVQRAPALSEALEQSRAAILDGRFDEARERLTTLLTSHSSNAEALFLLADCERKSGRFIQAVEAYRRIEDSAGPQDRQRAMFRSAAILQDKLGQHRPAAIKLEQYLSTSGAGDGLKPEAMLRLARIYATQGRQTESKRLLQAIVREHAGSGAASVARDTLAGSRAR